MEPDEGLKGVGLILARSPPPHSTEPLAGYQCPIDTSASGPAGRAALQLSAGVAVTHGDGSLVCECAAAAAAPKLHFTAAGEVAAFPPPSTHDGFRSSK